MLAHKTPTGFFQRRFTTVVMTVVVKFYARNCVRLTTLPNEQNLARWQGTRKHLDTTMVDERDDEREDEKGLLGGVTKQRTCRKRDAMDQNDWWHHDFNLHSAEHTSRCVEPLDLYGIVPNSFSKSKYKYAMVHAHIHPSFASFQTHQVGYAWFIIEKSCWQVVCLLFEKKDRHMV